MVLGRDQSGHAAARPGKSRPLEVLVSQQPGLLRGDAPAGHAIMTIAWRARTLRRPEYVANLDLVAVAPDGRLAAFCICRLHKAPEASSGQIEPMGVHQLRAFGLLKEDHEHFT